LFTRDIDSAEFRHGTLYHGVDVVEVRNIGLDCKSHAPCTSDFLRSCGGAVVLDIGNNNVGACVCQS